MTITLRPDQEAWLRARSANGDPASLEATARRLFDLLMAEEAQAEAGQPDDMAWARPLVEEARAAVSRGEVISLEEFEARSAALLASLSK